MVTTAPPDLKTHLEKLVGEHRRLADEPLLLAVYFEPERQQGDVFVFEVIEGFGDNRVDDDRKLFEVSYASTPSFPLSDGHRLHLVLTNPLELAFASGQGWTGLDEVRRAARQGRAVTIYADPSRPELERAVYG